MSNVIKKTMRYKLILLALAINTNLYRVNQTRKGMEYMQRQIINGVTILTTGSDGNGDKNKNGFRGVTYYKEIGKYRAEIQLKRKKFALGFFEDMQDAINARLVAEKRKEDGTLMEFLKSKPHGNSDRYMDFWKNQFEILKEG